MKDQRIKWGVHALVVVALLMSACGSRAELVRCTPNQAKTSELFLEKVCNDHLAELEHSYRGYWVYQEMRSFWDMGVRGVPVTSGSTAYQVIVPQCKKNQILENGICKDIPAPNVFHAEDLHSYRDLGWMHCSVEDSSNWCAAWYPWVDVIVIGKIPEFLRCQDQTWNADGTVTVHPYMHCGDLNFTQQMIPFHGLYAYAEAKHPAALEDVCLSRQEVREMLGEFAQNTVLSGGGGGGSAPRWRSLKAEDLPKEQALPIKHNGKCYWPEVITTIPLQYDAVEVPCLDLPNTSNTVEGGLVNAPATKFSGQDCIAVVIDARGLMSDKCGEK